MTLQVGDWVEVRRADEILATLNESGSVNGLPFMPEMLRYCGRRFKVSKSAHKTCDTISEYVIRRMTDTVHLENLRCDGSSHGGCEAHCLLFWKEQWLRKVEGPTTGSSDSEATTRSSENSAAMTALYPSTEQTPADHDAEKLYRCQATELLRATSEVRRRDRWNPFFYVKDVTSGNVALSTFIVYSLLAAANAFTLRWFGRRYPHVCGLAGKQTPTAETGLRPGEIVRVRSKTEIMKTLNSAQRNRGLWFDVEMLPYCGSEQRVLHRVEKIVDEKTGRLVRFPNPCIILEGVTCGGRLSTSRMFCPRAIYPYWREIWLKRVEAP